MNSLHGTKIANDERAVRGQTLTFRKKTGQLVLNGEALDSVTFLSRRSATDWARRHLAVVSPV